MPKRPYPAWQRRHEGVLLWLLEHPGARLKDCARATGYSPSQLSRITCSAEFSRRHRAALDTALRDAARRLLNGPHGGHTSALEDTP